MTTILILLGLVAHSDLWNLAIDVAREQSSHFLPGILPFYKHIGDILSHSDYSLKSEFECLLKSLCEVCEVDEGRRTESFRALLDLVESLRTPRCEGLMRKYGISNSHDLSPSFESIWIVKPTALSCGRDIVVVRGVRQLLAQLAVMNYNCVVQKYIERPLLVRNRRKFDIRQWILVTNLNPVIIYGFSECYLRLSGREFDLFATDKFTHLCNHSIQKDDVDQRAENSNFGICETMMTLQEFREFLHSLDPSIDLYATRIFPQIREICINSVLCCRERLEKFGKGFEWLGLDLMVTENLEVALLEVNVSPDTTLSTPVTSRLVGPATNDLFTLIFDEHVVNGNTVALETVQRYYECYACLSRSTLQLTPQELHLASRWSSECVSGKGVEDLHESFNTTHTGSPPIISTSDLMWKLWYVGPTESQSQIREISSQKRMATGILTERTSSNPASVENSLNLQREYKSFIDRILSYDDKLSLREIDEDEI